MPISLRAASGGGAGTPIGGYQDFNEWLPYDLDINGARYLRTGYIETNTSKFDNTIWAETVGTYYTGSVQMPEDVSADDWVVSSADNGTNTIVAVRGLKGQGVRLYVSTNSGVTWQLITWNVGNIRVHDIVWVTSLGLFVAVADAGLIGTSPDGTTWTTRYNVSGDGNITSIAFGAGRLVAVSTGNKVITSTNGTSWSYATTVPATTGIIDVAFGGGKFIAAANSNQCLTSTDGNTWSIQNLNLGSNYSLLGITYGDNKWLTYTNTVVSSTGQAGFWQSSDGVTFTLINSSYVPQQYGAKARCEFIGGFWLSYTQGGTLRSKDLTQWKAVNYIINSVNPVAFTYICYHLNKWLMFRMAYNGTSVTATYVHYGNNSMYAGSPFIMYSYPVIVSGGMTDNKQVLNKYVRIS